MNNEYESRGLDAISVNNGDSEKQRLCIKSSLLVKIFYSTLDYILVVIRKLFLKVRPGSSLQVWLF